MKRTIKYFYQRESLGKDEFRMIHERTIVAIKAAGPIAVCSVQPHEEAFPSEDDRNKFFDELRDFGMRKHVKLGKLFGSNSRGFWHLPAQFLLVYEDGDLREVFPCEVEGNVIEPVDFLESLIRGEPWTVQGSKKRKEGGIHKELVERLRNSPELLETGLVFVAADVHVSQGFGETGYIDLLFKDKDGRSLIVEVKAKVDEIDKAIGQVMRHKDLFVRQNFITDIDKVRVAIACPDVPAASRRICESNGISCFDIAWARGSVEGK